jgi:uncharacterized protein
MNINKLFKLWIPIDRSFYPLFEKDAENLLITAELLKKLMNTDDLAFREEIIKNIKEREHAGDEITHQIFDKLNQVFITPFDREDINELTTQMDDIVDFINSTAQKISLYKIKNYCPEYSKMAELIYEAAIQVNIAIKELKDLKNPEKINEACIKIDNIENQADDLYHFGISQLFEKETDTTELIKHKEILEALERATDQEEDVADVLKTIVIKRS